VSNRQTIAMPDGRDVEFLTAGPDDGFPLVLHDGTPFGLVPFETNIAAASVRGLRVIQIARPGYERSTPRPGRRVADVTADVARVLDYLDAETFITAGWSGGGPHALACAALVQDRCLAAASIAGVAPFHAAGLDWTAGMAPENVQEFGAAANGPEDLTRFLEAAIKELASVTGADVAASLGDLVSAVDAAAVTGEYADTLAAGLRAAISGGVAGWRDDDLAFVSDWGFTLGWDDGLAELLETGLLGDDPLPAPVAIWQGDQDRMVPFAHGQWLAATIPGARVHMMRGEGHLTLALNSIGLILDDLMELAGLTRA
jgi:pimeloyl-ACP methyl ester carboxylesterase